MWDSQDYRRLCSSFENANADLMTRLFLIDDPYFTEVENHISEPFGRNGFLCIMD